MGFIDSWLSQEISPGFGSQKILAYVRLDKFVKDNV